MQPSQTTEMNHPHPLSNPMPLPCGPPGSDGLHLKHLSSTNRERMVDFRGKNIAVYTLLPPPPDPSNPIGGDKGGMIQMQKEEVAAAEVKGEETIAQPTTRKGTKLIDHGQVRQVRWDSKNTSTPKPCSSTLLIRGQESRLTSKEETSNQTSHFHKLSFSAFFPAFAHLLNFPRSPYLPPPHTVAPISPPAWHNALISPPPFGKQLLLPKHQKGLVRLNFSPFFGIYAVCKYIDSSEW